MRPEERGALPWATRWAALFLASALAGCSQQGAPPSARAGADLYGGNCVACHQQNAQGIPGVYPSLVGSSVVLGDPVAFALWVVKGQRPASLPAGRYATVMPQFGWMKDGDIAALLSYLRSNFGNSAPPVEAAALSRAFGE
jgi:mono/diheme cytochrome c family protein